jgi:hypothetical protein
MNFKVVTEILGLEECQFHNGRKMSSLMKQTWLHGPMARRLTTNQEIPGSTPGVINTNHFFCWSFFFFYLSQASSVWLFVGCVVLIMFLFGTNYCLVRHPYYSNSKDNTKHSHDSGAQAGIW